MCVIATCRPGEIPSKRRLKAACRSNPDGFGWAVVAHDPRGSRILTGHSMNPRPAINSFLKARRAHMDGYALFHARIATHGNVDLSNTHPFHVGGDPGIVVAHNGILPIYPQKGDVRSDSKVFAEDMLPGMGITSLDNPWTTAALNAFVDGSKLVVLSVSPQLRHECYFLGGKWIESDGVLWSNSSYEPNYKSYQVGAVVRPLGAVADDDDDEYWEIYDEDRYDRCPLCNSPLDSYARKHMVCYFCETCLICEKQGSECECSIGAVAPFAGELSKSVDEVTDAELYQLIEGGD